MREAVLFFGFLVVFSSGVLQGITSFGFALLAMPVLAALMPLKLVIPLVVILCLLTNFIILARGGLKHVNVRQSIVLIASGIAGLPLGTYILLAVDEKILKLLVGIIITLCSVFLLAGVRLRTGSGLISLVPVGFLSGLLNSAISLSSPPVALFYSNQGMGKNSFRSNLTVFFAVLNIVTVSGYFLNRLVSRAVIEHTLVFLPALIAGVLLGNHISRKLEDFFFKRFTLGLTFLTGVLTTITALGSMF